MSILQVNDNKVMMMVLVARLIPLAHSLPYCTLVSQAIFYDVDENGMKVYVQLSKLPKLHVRAYAHIVTFL